MSLPATQNSPFPAMILPYLASPLTFWLMMSSVNYRFVSAALAATLTAFTAVGAHANMHIIKVEFSEFPTETAAIVIATTAYFDSVEAGESEVPKIQPGRVIGDFVTAASANVDVPKSGPFETDRGPVQNLTGYRISWYPVDRFLGSVDFMGTWDGNRNLVCGYVTWDLSDPDEPVLDTVTANYVDVAALSGSTPAQVHQTLLDANCAYGEIDPNFTLFDPAQQPHP